MSVEANFLYVKKFCHSEACAKKLTAPPPKKKPKQTKTNQNPTKTYTALTIFTTLRKCLVRNFSSASRRNAHLQVFLIMIVMTMLMNASKEDDQMVLARCPATWTSITTADELSWPAHRLHRSQAIALAMPFAEDSLNSIPLQNGERGEQEQKPQPIKAEKL